ncbi:DoxX family protein [Streptacidiphilus cavernicola]|uniref:DoxX family protein n=1 Tax=Streptacidiphilus cavernicola TaxID=3342716 RepID=A0ABV6W4Z6_9ACTN
MNIALWIAQGLLAAVFLGSGVMKSTQTKEKMIETGQTGVAPFPLPAIRAVAALELLAAVGLIAPQLTGIAPVLTPLAAVGLMAVMIGAAVSHWSLREYKQVFGVNLVLFLVCLFVALGRF